MTRSQEIKIECRKILDEAVAFFEEVQKKYDLLQLLMPNEYTLYCAVGEGDILDVEDFNGGKIHLWKFDRVSEDNWITQSWAGFKWIYDTDKEILSNYVAIDFGADVPIKEEPVISNYPVGSYDQIMTSFGVQWDIMTLRDQFEFIAKIRWDDYNYIIAAVNHFNDALQLWETKEEAVFDPVARVITTRPEQTKIP